MLQGVLQRGAVCCKSGVAVFVAGCVVLDVSCAIDRAHKAYLSCL